MIPWTTGYLCQALRQAGEEKRMHISAGWWWGMLAIGDRACCSTVGHRSVSKIQWYQFPVVPIPSDQGFVWPDVVTEYACNNCQTTAPSD